MASKCSPCWCGPARRAKLAARDAWVGWDPRTRTRRVPLLVQNNRFLVLADGRQPNLASRVLGLAVAALPGHWQAHTGTTPLLAETFVDPERYQGTSYKASAWIEVGRTKLPPLLALDGPALASRPTSILKSGASRLADTTSSSSSP